MLQRSDLLALQEVEQLQGRNEQEVGSVDELVEVVVKALD